MTSLIIKSKLEINKWLNQFIKSSQKFFENFDSSVEEIIQSVKSSGDDALINLSYKYDNVKLDKSSLFFSDKEINAALNNVKKNEREAIELAASRIKKYHKKQLPINKFWKDKMGIELGYRWTPISSIGIYVPGGKASYPSSVLMNAIPAKVAGVKKITMVTPVPYGKVNPLVLFGPLQTQ